MAKETQQAQQALRLKLQGLNDDPTPAQETPAQDSPQEESQLFQHLASKDFPAPEELKGLQQEQLIPQVLKLLKLAVAQVPPVTQRSTSPNMMCVVTRIDHTQRRACIGFLASLHQQVLITPIEVLMIVTDHEVGKQEVTVAWLQPLIEFMRVIHAAKAGSVPADNANVNIESS